MRIFKNVNLENYCLNLIRTKNNIKYNPPIKLELGGRPLCIPIFLLRLGSHVTKLAMPYARQASLVLSRAY